MYYVEVEHIDGMGILDENYVTLEGAFLAAKTYLREDDRRFPVRVYAESDDEGILIARFVIMAEGEIIDTASRGWLNHIRLEYGIDENEFAREVLHWLNGCFSPES
jgi:hypothetical protein